jgi:hypothetical protein
LYNITINTPLDTTDIDVAVYGNVASAIYYSHIKYTYMFFLQ